MSDDSCGMGQDLSSRISQQLLAGTYECANCLESIHAEHTVWHCLCCYRVFHFGCIKKWSQQHESGEGRTFRCPHCQTVQKPVTRSRCFCSRTVDPRYDPSLSCPHSCGGTCGRRRGGQCPHPCPLQCHPGPCPECPNTAPQKRCPCGRTTYTYRCGRPDPLRTCDNPCGKRLSCGTHRCPLSCHRGPCPPCRVVVQVSCTCKKTTSEMPCGSKTHHCNTACGKLQRCGEHHCDVVCHAGECPPCDRDPSIICTCPCGKRQLKDFAGTDEGRKTCLDAIPTCGQPCDRVLPCKRHNCTEQCHDSPCKPCDIKISVHCPCRSTMGRVLCKEAENFHCSKKCKTLLSCGKHECETLCCASRNDPSHAVHQCKRICQKKLSCGHVCEELCHRGACPPCPNIITAPLQCRCGAEVLMPPLPCGAAHPTCHRPCPLDRPCGHPPGDHDCHHGDCPPCVRPVVKMCAGGHRTLSNVLCSAPAATCTSLCEKPLLCGHPCTRFCHAGDCVTAERPCGSLCGRALACGHPCQQRCHNDSKCGKCQASVQQKCSCGRRTASMPCAAYLKKMGAGGLASDPPNLECDSSCFHENRLSVLKSISKKPGDGTKKSIFSPRLWASAETSVDFVRQMEERLAAFLASSETSMMLPAMLREKRSIVHEMCYFYHLESESHDEEPNRTILVTQTARSAEPAPKLSEALQRPNLRPHLYVDSIMDDVDEAQKRIVVFEGKRLTEFQVYRCLHAFAGDFVVVEPSDEQLFEPRRLPPGSVASSDEALQTFYAVFLPHRIKEAYAHLRQHGCTALYHLLGFPYPPKSQAWEPARPEASVLRKQHKKKAASHVDPAEIPSDVAAEGPSAVWAALVRQRPSEHVNAKTRKEQANSKLDVSNRFASLR